MLKVAYFTGWGFCSGLIFQWSEWKGALVLLLGFALAAMWSAVNEI